MILVTGGTGMLGSHLLLELVQRHNVIRAIHRPSSDLQQVHYVFSLYHEDPDTLYSRIEWHEADTGDMDSLLGAFEGIRYVYHAAASVSFDPGERYTTIRNNVEGTANVVNACLEKNIRKLCYVSSSAALGQASDGNLITENTAWSPPGNRSSYPVSKYKSEMEVWRGIAEGLNAVIVNPVVIIGPGDWKKSSPLLFSVVWKGMKYYSEGITGFVDVRDVVSVMTRLMEGNFAGERYTICSENLSYRQVLEMIAGSLNRKPPHIHAGSLLVSIARKLDWIRHILTGKKRSITRETARAGLQKSYFSNEKVKKATGIEFRPVHESIRDTARFYLNGVAENREH